MTAWQRFGGTYYSAAGYLDLESGTFVRTGVNWNQAVIYGFDASVTAAAIGGAAYGPMGQ
jgi:hypothetical protein